MCVSVYFFVCVATGVCVGVCVERLWSECGGRNRIGEVCVESWVCVSAKGETRSWRERRGCV